MSRAFTLKQRVVLAIVPRLAVLLIRLLGATWRYEEVVEPGAVPGYQVPGPGVYAFWHRCLLAAAHRFRGNDIAILISSSFDGELIARTVERLGFRAVRGSSSRGGAAGLRGMQQAYVEGHRCAFTADGPKGPLYLAKPGAAQLASLVTAPGSVAARGGKGTWVGCFYLLPLRAWELRSWDRFLIPKPFSKIVVSWTAHVPAEAVTVESVQAALDRSVALAERVALAAGAARE